MLTAHTPEPSGDATDSIHARLLARDPTAPEDLARHYLDALIVWLGGHNSTIPEDLIDEAAEDAILTLIRNPASYRPGQMGLEAYLRMSAQGDLRNRLRKEEKHRTGRESLESVELSDTDGKYLGSAEDPSLPLMIEEELAEIGAGVPDSVRDGLTEQELRVLELMLQGERRTAVFAEALRIVDQPLAEQRMCVKQLKDRLQKRVERARGSDEQEP